MSEWPLEQATFGAQFQMPRHELHAQENGGDTLWVWGPDGPVDQGDDVYVRVTREWLCAIAPALHSITV
ncbi:hypothetical protein MSPP1_002743 [Malassezia sp. CBS 17886]|nr:hypothetical protein MSPP1_002743 [Malassezia sp. CBS 17886]